MIAQMAGGDPVQAVAPAPPAAKSETNGPLGQDDIDAMIAQMAGGGPVQAVAPAPPAAKSETSGPLGQDDIDAMLAQMEAAAPAAPAAPVKASKPPAAVESAQGPLDQNSIDTLLAQLGANTEAKVGAAPKAAGPGAPPLASKAAADLSLTTEDLQSLVAKHEGQAGNPASDTMIAQADIDALVQQLAMATGGEAGAPNEALGEALAKHEAAIDRLLGDAQNAAVDPTDVIPGVGSKPKAPAPVVHAPHGPGQGGPGWSGPVMAPLEIRGARWLLMAAVLLLGICAATLVGVTASIHRLTGELKAERVAQMGDGVGAPGVFADDYQSAMALLEDSDAERQAKGELFLARLKPRHPAHAVEISLVLARHFRAHQAWRPALREYAEVVEGSRRLLDDPRIYLEYAEVLSAVGDRDAALRTIYLPLANESAYTGERDLRRALRPAREAAANRVALQECQLLLGRMLGDRRGPALALGEPHAAAPAHGHEAPAPAQGSH